MDISRRHAVNLGLDVPWNIPPSAAYSNPVYNEARSDRKTSHLYQMKQQNTQMGFDNHGRLKRVNSCPDIIMKSPVRGLPGRPSSNPQPRPTFVMASRPQQYKQHTMGQAPYSFYYNFDGVEEPIEKNAYIKRHLSGGRKTSVLQWAETGLRRRTRPETPVIVRRRLPRMFNQCETRIHSMAPASQTAPGEALRNWGCDAAVHGIRNVFVHQPFVLRRVVWALLVLVAAASIGYHTYHATAYFLTRPVSINVDIRQANSIRFPAVTICNHNAFRATVAARQGRYFLITDMFSRNEENLESFNFTSYEAESMTLDDLYLSATHRKEDLIISCQWNEGNCSLDDFIATFTDFGVCYTFNSGQYAPILYSDKAGSTWGLRLLLNIEQYEYMHGPHQGAGVKVLVHNREEIARVESDGLSLPPGSHSEIQLQYTQTSYLKPPHGQCEDSKTLRYFDTYSIDNCMSECSQLFIQERCQCRDLHMSPKDVGEWYPVCTLQQYQDCLVDANKLFQKTMIQYCNCYQPCKSSFFEVAVTYGAISEDEATFLQTTNLTQTGFSIETLQQKYTEARDLTQRALPSVMASDAKLITKFQNVIEKTNTGLQDIIRQLNEAQVEVKNLKFEINRRIWFHHKWGLDGLKYVLEEKFIRGWEVMKKEVFDYVTMKMFHFTDSVKRTLVQMTENENSTEVRGQRSEVLAMLAQIWNDRLQVKIMTIDRASEYLNRLDDAISSVEPLLESNFTINGRYDAAYLSSTLVDPDPSSRSDKIKEAVRVNGRIPNIFQKMQIFISSYVLNEKDFIKAQDELLVRTSQFDGALKIVEDDVVYHPLKRIEDRELCITKLNESMNMYVTEFNRKVDDVMDYILNINRSHVERLLLVSYNVSKYLNDVTMRKSVLAQVISTPDVLAAVNNLKPFFSKLYADRLVLKDKLAYIERTLVDVWSAFLNDTLLMDFYREINSDFVAYSAQTGDDLKPVFSSLLGIKTDAVSAMDKDELSLSINADVATLTIGEKLEQLRSMFSRIANSTDASRILGSIGAEFEDAAEQFVDSLRDYKWSSSVDSRFIKDNFIYADVYLNALVVKSLTQDVAYDGIGLLGDVGGGVGLFLGASVISVVEFIDVIFYQILRCCNRLKHNHR